MGLFSFGGSGSSSSSESESQAASDTFLSGLQSPFLRSLFTDASQLAGDQGESIGASASDLSRALLGSGGGFLRSLEGVSGGDIGNDFSGIVDSLSGVEGSDLAQLIQQRFSAPGAGAGTLSRIAGGGFESAAGGVPGGPLAGTDRLMGIDADLDALLGESPALAGSIDSLDQMIQNNLRGVAGTIAGQATLAGATGGARQALATGQAGQEAVRQFSQGATRLVSEDFAGRRALAPAVTDARLGAATALQGGDLASRGLELERAGLSDRSALAGTALESDAAGRLMSGEQFDTAGLSELLGRFTSAGGAAGGLALGGADTAVGAGSEGLGSLGGLFNLGQAPFGAEFQPLLQLAQILGDPILLNRARSSSSSSSESDSQSMKFGFGGS